MTSVSDLFDPHARVEAAQFGRHLKRDDRVVVADDEQARDIDRAHHVAIRGAGPVTASSAVVLYAERLLGSTAASLVDSINKLYGMWKAGETSWNLARTLCELEGFCS